MCVCVCDAFKLCTGPVQQAIRGCDETLVCVRYVFIKLCTGPVRQAIRNCDETGSCCIIYIKLRTRPVQQAIGGSDSVVFAFSSTLPCHFLPPS